MAIFKLLSLGSQGLCFLLVQMEFETMDKQREEEEWNMLSKDEQVNDTIHVVSRSFLSQVRELSGQYINRN